MGNMSYCRFRNTLRDLKDCLEALEEGEPVNREERAAAIRLIEVAGQVAACDAPDSDGVDEDEDDEED